MTPEKTIGKVRDAEFDIFFDRKSVDLPKIK